MRSLWMSYRVLGRPVGRYDERHMVGVLTLVTFRGFLSRHTVTIQLLKAATSTDEFAR